METLKKYKIFFYSRNIIKLVFLNKIKKKKIIIFNSNSVIPKTFNNLTNYIYKGNLFKKLNINNYIVGTKYKYFIISTKLFNYPIKKKKNFLKR